MEILEKIQKLEEQIGELKRENKILKERLDARNEDFDYAIKYYNGELEKINFERFARLCYQYCRSNGVIKTLGKLFQCMWKVCIIGVKKVKRKVVKPAYAKELKKILRTHKEKKIMLFYPGYDWYMKMYQRPQHMAIHFAEKDILFFYCTMNINDKIDGIKQISENLYVTNQYDYLKKHLPKYTLYMCANMNGCFLKELKDIQKRGNDILYEYIDDLHEDLTEISNDLLERHNYVLKNIEIPVVTTAQHLFKKASKIRKSENNIILSTNGVVYEDFHITGKLAIPDKIKSIVKEKKPIIGYYGALAKWFDYELVEKIAKQHPEWNILLIGIDYDKEFAKYNYFNYLSNVYYIGPVEYKELIKYGACCDVLTIPFRINEITLSTSPVKVFEYMSMEKPIVTTDLPECRKYKSVLIGKNHEDFIKKLEVALEKKNDTDYKKILCHEAKSNTWESKVDEILNFITEEEKDEKKF